MKRYRLKNDVTVKFNGGGNSADGYDVHGKKGDAVLHVGGGTGLHNFALAAGRVDPGVASLFAHDGKYYYVWIGSENVEEVTT